MLYFFSLSFLACTDPIDFDIGEGSQYLVVDGFVTSNPGPHFVKLSTSASFATVFEGGFETPILGAQVWLRDDLGTYIALQEDTQGFYKTAETFSGVVGRKYSVHLITPDGEEYQSTPSLLSPPSEITEGYYELATVQTLSTTGALTEKQGIQFYIDSQFEVPNARYRWDWNITYLYETTFYSGPPAREFCYIDERALDHVVILDSRESGSQGVQRFPVEFMDLDIRFRLRCSVELSQYSITEDAYAYWKQIEQQRKNTGSVFDSAPANIQGNIININDGDDIILGRFDAYGESSKRLFINGFEIEADLPERDEACFPLGPGATPPPYCADCSLFPGSRPEKPDFWID